MPLNKIILRPGFMSQLTPTLNEGGFASGNLVRFRDGLLQKFGGWQAATSNLFAGVCRGLHSWIDLSGNLDCGVGTTALLYVLQGGTYYDVTPVTHTSSPLALNPFATVNGSPTITVTDAGYNPGAGDYVIFSGAAAVAGLTISGQYVVQTVPSGTTYTITASGNASATTTGGGAAVVATYLLPGGMTTASSGYGWGAGTWGFGTWGTPRSISSVATGPRIWWLDNWGEELIAAPRNAGIYHWLPSGGLATRAVVVTNAPLYNSAVLVGMPQRQLVAFGAESGGVQDPMLIRWTDVEDYTDWTATATNQAGSFRLAGGNFIVGAVSSTQQILVFTDAVVYSMAYIRPPYVYGFRQLGTGCGLIAPHAAVDVNGVTYWMSVDHFNAYTGTVTHIPCDVWDTVFLNLNRNQTDKICAGVNSSFSEVIWFYPSASSDEIDSYVAYNYEQRCWYTGNLVRTAWVDREEFTYPFAVDASGQAYFQEFGNDANGTALSCTATTGYFDIGDGQEYSFIDRIIPDFDNFSGQLSLTVTTLNHPFGTPVVKGPYTVTPSTRYVNLRARGRQASLTIASSNVGDFWRIGAVRVNITPDGRR